MELLPIISIVLYFGKKKWDGAKNLREMLDLSILPEKLQGFVSDYEMNLVEVCKYEHLEYFQSDLRQVFGFLQNADKGEELKKYVEENAKGFSNLEEDAFDMITVMSHSRELRKMKKGFQKEEGGNVNMCQAIKELMHDSEARGIALGEARGESRGEARGEARGKMIGEEQGILLAKRVFAYSRMNLRPEVIAQNCGVSVEKVKMILEP